MSKKDGIKVIIFECHDCVNAHLGLVMDGKMVFSASVPPDVWAKMFKDVSEIEAKHAAKH